MAVPYGKRFPMEFDKVFPEGAYVLGEITAVTEYQSPEDKPRNRPVRPRIDEASRLPIIKVTIAEGRGERPECVFSQSRRGITMDLHSHADGPSRGRRKAIPATCELHRGPAGLANLMVSMQGGSIVLDPHVTGACVISLHEDSARTLCNLLTEWLE